MNTLRNNLKNSLKSIGNKVNKFKFKDLIPTKIPVQASKAVSLDDVTRTIESHEQPDGSVTYSFLLKNGALATIYALAKADEKITVKDLLYQAAYAENMTLKEALIGAHLLNQLKDQVLTSKILKYKKANKSKAKLKKQSKK